MTCSRVSVISKEGKETSEVCREYTESDYFTRDSI